MEAIDFETARSLPASERTTGLKVKGTVAPFGGRWIYDPQTDEITLAEEPTKGVL